MVGGREGGGALRVEPPAVEAGILRGAGGRSQCRWRVRVRGEELQFPAAELQAGGADEGAALAGGA